MRIERNKARVALIVPALAGLGVLAGGLMLLPGRREILHAERRAQPATAVSALPSPVAATPPPAQPEHPTIAAAIPVASAATLAALTARLIGDGEAVSTAQVAYDLVAAGRPSVALAYMAARPDGASLATWRLRVDLLHGAGRDADAAALVARAARTHVVPAADLIAAAYAIDRTDLVIVAAANHVVPPPDAALARDLARRADAAGRDDLIALLDRTHVDWRAGDPWLAIRVATRTGDRAAALRAADHLPAAQRTAARESILSGDREALRTELLAQSDTPPEAIAERLLAAGYRDDAKAVLRRAASGLPLAAPATQRLLYLMGPRPAADDLGWLKNRAVNGDAAEQRGWLGVYAEHDRPSEALAFVSRHPLAARTDVMLLRLSLARAADDAAAARVVLSGLLDGRALEPAQVRALAAAAPARLDPAQATAIVRRRVAAGIAEPYDRTDLAWAAWNAGDAKGAAGWLRDHLATMPTDLPALRLMADVQTRIGGERAARPWLERALAQTPQQSRPRAELLDRLGRRGEAVTLVEALRNDAPQDRALAALQARLLIAQGQPGRARAVLSQ